jgi:hypothetical protein
LADIRPIEESKSAVPIMDSRQMPGAVPQAGSCAAVSQAKTVHAARIPAASRKNLPCRDQILGREYRDI